MLRRLTAVLALVGLVLLSAGCLKVDSDLEVSPDDTVSGSMVTAMRKDAISTIAPLVGASGEDPRAVWDAMQEESDQDLPEGATVEPFEDDEFVGDRIIFDAVPISEFGSAMGSDEGGEFSLTREGDTFVFRGAFDLSSSASSEGVSSAQMQSFFSLYGKPEMKTVITFPGKVVETNGEVEGTQVSWTRDLSSTTQEPMTATAMASGGAVRGDETKDESRAGQDRDAPALVATGAGLGGLVILVALVGMGLGVNRALQG